jgi:hypothetical protein
MDQKTFSIVAGVIFAAVALLHLVRIYMDWPVMIGGWSVPRWVSWIGLSSLVASLFRAETRRARCTLKRVGPPQFGGLVVSSYCPVVSSSQPFRWPKRSLGVHRPGLPA